MGLEKNVCNLTEKIVRVIAGLIILGAGWYYQSLWGLVGLIPLVTVAIGWCPLSYILGVNTCKIKTASGS